MGDTDIYELINTIEEAIEYVSEVATEKLFTEQDYLLRDIVDGVQSVNKDFFESETIVGHDVDKYLEEAYESKDIAEYVEGIKKWLKDVKNHVMYLENQANDIDYKFAWLMDYLKYVEKDTLILHVKQRLLNMEVKQIGILQGYYQAHSHFWGTLDIKNNRYDVICNRIDMLTDHREDFIWLYKKLGDYRSKLVLVNMLYNWISFEPTYIKEMCENNFRDYYDLDLLQCDENEVVVDIGAYTGDSARGYIETFRKYKKMYCYEITPETVEQMKTNLGGYSNIEIVNKGVGKESGKMYLQTLGLDTSTNGLDENGSGKEIEVVTIDEDIKEKITLIKMDIEGAEKDALQGCRRHVVEEKPKLLICVYHNNSDIWEMPQMIMDMRDDYKLYLRSNGMQWGPAEIVLFAL